MSKGQLYGIGVGPGDPELVTVKAVKYIEKADIIAFPTAKGASGNAKRTIEPYITQSHQLMSLTYPVTAGPVADSETYLPLMKNFYDSTAQEMKAELLKGKNIAIICAGDPFIFGSYMYWHARLVDEFETTVIPGISSILAAPVELGKPLCHREDVVSIIPATLSEDELVENLTKSTSAVIMKLGRTFPKVISALKKAGLENKAYYVERATMQNQRILPVLEVDPTNVAYFSVVVIPCQTPE